MSVTKGLDFIYYDKFDRSLIAKFQPELNESPHTPSSGSDSDNSNGSPSSGSRCRNGKSSPVLPRPIIDLENLPVWTPPTAWSSQ
jgi:hypothetical protein